MKIENYFQSDDFARLLKPLKYIFEKNDFMINTNIIGYLVSICIRYSILFGDKNIFSTNGLNEFVENVVNYIASIDYKNYSSLSHYADEYVLELYKKILLKELNLTEYDLLDEKIKHSVSTLIIKKIMGNQFKYHAFNSVFYESIKENGITPNIMFTSQQEIDNVDKIFEKYGISMIFGWRKLNCEGKVSYSETPSVSYYYGINSPEWFGQFTGQGVSFNPYNKYNKNAFVECDYAGAKNNLLTLMNENNFSKEDINYVINFFEKNWQMYANTTPILAIIPKEYEEKKVDFWLNALLNKSYLKDDIEDVLGSCFNTIGVDYQTSETIITTNATFVELPNYAQLINKICFQKNKVDKEQLKQNNDEIIYEKLMYLTQSKIRIMIDQNGEKSLVSEHGIQEVEKVKEILCDDDVYRAVISDKFGKDLFNGWINYFDSKIVNLPENIKLLAKNKPEYFGNVSLENRSNIQLMRECSLQKGIKPKIMCYVGKNVQDDFEFICNLIINSDEETFDFYGESAETVNGSSLRYGESIGCNVRSNPNFWRILNSKIMSINENTLKRILFFDIDKELELINNELIYDGEQIVENKYHK